MFNPDTGRYRFIFPHLRRRPGHSRSSQSGRPFIATRTRHCRRLSSCGHLRRSHSTRRQAGRSPGAVSDKIRDGCEPIVQSHFYGIPGPRKLAAEARPS
jgi:hypothetical protein